MICEKVPLRDRSCIMETILKIDQIQKEALIQDQCETCKDSLVVKMFNTKPVIFYLCEGKKFEVEVPGSDTCTHYFRIQEIKGDCVVLRILVRCGCEWECTNFTVNLDVRCVCAIQCLPPICCEECRKGQC